MKYNYSYSSGGTVQKGAGDFESLQALKDEIGRQGGILLEYKGQASGAMNQEIKLLEKKPNSGDLAMFAEQMSVMLESGANVRRSLHDIGRDLPNPTLKAVVGELEQDVEVGLSLSEAMSKHPIFDSLMVSLVRAGEASNNMDTMMLDLGRMKRDEAELNNKVRSAMVYPMVMLTTALLITYVMLTKMVPQFADMVTQTGGKMPALTAAVMSFSNFLVANQLVVLIGIPVLIYGFISYRKTPEGKAQVDRLQLKIPIIGALLRANTVARVSRSISLLLKNGVRVPQTVRIVQGIADNTMYRRALEEVGEGVQVGDRMSVLMRQFPDLFPGMMTSMMAIGEESGKIDVVMAKSAEHFEREASHRAETMTKAIEPVMLIVVGVLIGTIVIAMFLPLFSIMNNIQGGGG